MIERGYATDPQIMFGRHRRRRHRPGAAAGRPVRIGQPDGRATPADLPGGRGTRAARESYELAAYFIARHTVTDAWQRRGRKGSPFLIGDEMNKHRLEARHILRTIGDEVGVDLRTDSVHRDLQQRWETFFVLPRQPSHFDDRDVNSHWRDLLGERFLKLDDPAAVSDLIALTIGMTEGRIDLGQGLADLGDVGTRAEQSAVARALLAVSDPRASASAATGRGGRR